jgi:hypothetical protein
MKIPMALLLVAAACGAPDRLSREPTAGVGSARSAESADAASLTPPGTVDPRTTQSTSPAGAPPSPDDTGGSVLIGEIAAPKSFNPAPTLAGLVPNFLACFRSVRAKVPSLRGKLKLRVTVNEAGAPQSVAAEPGGSANDPALVSCLADALRGATFPKPGGTAIISVPLLFRP